MTVLPLCLLLLVPGDWEADPPALAELRRHLSDEYRARLEVRWATTRTGSPLCLYLGCWGDLGQTRDPGLRDRISASFFSLDWLEVGEVG